MLYSNLSLINVSTPLSQTMPQIDAFQAQPAGAASFAFWLLLSAKFPNEDVDFLCINEWQH